MEDNETSGLVQALRIARRRWLLLLLTPVIAATAGYALSSSQPPRYEATAILLAGQGGSQLGTIDEVGSANQAAIALGTMASDRVVLEQALRSIDESSADVQSLLAETRIAVPTDSQKIEVTVGDSDPARAARLANAVAESFAELVEDREATRFNLAATMWQRAVRPVSPVAPDVPMTTIAAMLVGILLGVALALARETLDSTWRSELDVEGALDQPVLAVIPRIRARHRRIGGAT